MLMHAFLVELVQELVLLALSQRADHSSMFSAKKTMLIMARLSAISR
jgi:hypothetical protein